MGELITTFQNQTEDLADATENMGIAESPVDAGQLAELVEQYKVERQVIESVSSLIKGHPGLPGALHYFNEAARSEDRYVAPISTGFFDHVAAVKALDADYWSKALKCTDVLESMPQARRSEWAETIRTHKAPEFTAEAVRSTILDLLNSRLRFFAERVDGIFRALSKTHVTQQPQGFTARLIITKVIDDIGLVRSEKSGYISDLRCVIARLMGRQEPSNTYTHETIYRLQSRCGEWVDMDGGAWRIKLFKNGNCHIEVGRDMAWRLNAILANLYPTAIPSQFRKRPVKDRKEIPLCVNTIPFSVVGVLSEMVASNAIGYHAWERKKFTECENVRYFRHGISDNTRQYVGRLLESIGGVAMSEKAFRWFEFDYDPTNAINHMIITRTVPDHVSHQYYPTQEELALVAIGEADIQPEDKVLEPEAGQGGIAQHLPVDQTVCVEISALHCKVLQAKGLNVVNADFIEWAKTAPMFDKVISNPPFANGRAVLHVTTSAGLVVPGGRLVAILPGSLRGKDILGPGWDVCWSEPYQRQFEGTDVTVVIMTAKRH